MYFTINTLNPLKKSWEVGMYYLLPHFTNEAHRSHVPEVTKQKQLNKGLNPGSLMPKPVLLLYHSAFMLEKS
jgi:hypothetical protein